jgi:tetratricopeptide (TPR) repeat protein
MHIERSKLMTPQRWQQIQALFDQAIQSEPAQRENVLAGACDGDPQLRAEVEALLAHDAQVERAGFLPSPGPADVAPNGTGKSQAAGLGSVTVAGYEILAELGRGGMGVVYQARQIQVNRLVALKMILAGAHAGPEALTRFRREAEAVARLEHPHIVRLYEYGDRHGLPYYSMELVDGGNLAQKLGGVPQPAAQAAQFLHILAQALHCAHQNGIVHRDLKPANILLSGAAPSANGAGFLQPPHPLGTPKIADFGLAKHLDAGPGPTQTGMIVGTPSYMAPEQAAGQHKNIGPATDVYALGAILYEMLTGRPPFLADSPLATLQEVLSGEPVSVTRLQPKVPRDLETICLKCLEKEPRKRYASAAALAEDLRRFLTGESIGARPAGFAERFGRWSRRNPSVTALAACLLLVTIAAFAIVTWQWRRAEANFEQSNENFRQAREAVSRLNVVSEKELRIRSGMQPLRKKLLTDTLSYYDRLAQQKNDDAAIQLDLAFNNQTVGIVTSEIGKLDDALKAYQKAEALFEKLRRSQPEHTQNRNSLAANHLYVGLLQYATGQMDAARQSHQRALQIWQEAASAESHPKAQRNVALSQWAIGNVWVELGQPDKARSCYDQARLIQERLFKEKDSDDDSRDQLAYNDHSMGWLHHVLGQSPEALEYFQKARAHRARLVETDPRDISRQYYLAKTDLCLGIVYRTTAQEDKAITALNSARLSLEPLVNDNPEVTYFQRTLAEVQLNIGKIHHEVGRHTDARACFVEARGICLALAQDNPAVTQTQVVLADSYTALAHVPSPQDPPADPRGLLIQSREIWQRLATAHPDIPRFQTGLKHAEADLNRLDKK